MKNHDESDDWVTISDLMSGLMIIFLFISISYMINVTSEKEKIEKIMLNIASEKEKIEKIKEKMENIANTYKQTQNGIYIELFNEFKENLKEWNAEIRKGDLSVIFKEPDVLFDINDSKIKEKFKLILDDFFPRYIKILSSENYKNDIVEIRIEGHTSSEWNDTTTELDSYIKNMELSQSRTLSVLRYVLQTNIAHKKENESWLRMYLTANGLSSSHIIRYPNGLENKAASRRVEFKVRTNADQKIKLILSGS